MFPALLHFCWLFIQAFTALSLLAPAAFYLLHFVRRAFKKQPAPHDELHEEKDYAIIVSVCGPLQNIQATLQSLLRLHYSNYIIYVVGNYPADTGIRLQSDRLVYLRTATAYQNPVRLHRFAIESFKRPHTHIAVLDGNSLVDADYLTSLNTFFNEGYQAVKARTSMQNLTGNGRILQTLTVLYRNFFAGEVPFSLGSSSALSIAGTAFSVSFYKQCIKRIKTNSAGFVSSLQAVIIQSGRQVAFAPCAVVYNTKSTSYYEIIRHHAQRIHDWLFCLVSSGKMVIKGILKRDANQFVYGITSLRLPLSSSVFIGLACLGVNARINPAMASLWTDALFLVPVYLVLAATQFPAYKQRETADQNSNTFAENVFPLEENGYAVIMQTV